MLDIVRFKDIDELKEIKFDFYKPKTIIFAKSFTKSELEETKRKIKKQNFEFSVKLCNILSCSPKDIRREVSKWKSFGIDYVAYLGGTIEKNKNAIVSKVDFLFDPITDERFAFDTSSATLALQNNVKVVVFFEEFIKRKGLAKILFLKNLAMLEKVSKRKKMPVYFYSGAKKKFDLRGKNELSSFSEAFGYSKNQAEKFTFSEV